MTPLHKYYYPRYRASRFIQPRLDWLRFKQLVGKSRHSFANESFDQFDGVCRFLRDQDASLNLPSLSFVNSRAIYIRIIANDFLEMFKELRPQLGILESYHGTPGMAFSLACREFGIPCMDIQHGVAGEWHYAYGRWHNLPKTGYELLPSLFWCWGDAEAKAIEDWAVDQQLPHRAIIGGNLWLETWKRGNAPLINKYDKNLKEKMSASGCPRHVLFTLQGEESTQRLEMLAVLVKKTQESWFWWLRLHPSALQQAKRISEIFHRSSVGVRSYDLDQASALPLYALLRNVDLHMTGYSSTVIEAASFQVPSIILDNYSLGHYQKYIDSGAAVVAKDSESIVEAMEKLIASSSDNKPVAPQQLDASSAISQIIDMISH